MAEYIISGCSTADMTDEYFKENGIPYICFHYTLDGKEYLDDYGKSMDFAEFYKQVGAGVPVSTAQVTPEQYEELFTPYLEKGIDILHLTLSSGISGTWNSAKIAQSMLQERYPERKIEIIDSLAASSGYGLLLDIANDLRNQGKSIDEVRDEIEKIKLNIHHWFFSTDLSCFFRGGRISRTSAIFGTALHICPLMNVNSEGKLIPRYKYRGKKKVKAEMVNKMLECAKDGAAYAGKCFISNSACLEDAEDVRDLIEEKFPALKGQVKIFNIGTVIGAHTGPGTVALFFVGDERGI